MITKLKIAIDRKRHRRQRAKVERLHSQGIWMTGQGFYIPVAELGDTHLANIVALLRRRAAKQATAQVAETLSFYLTCPGPRGEMAQVAFEQELDYWIDGRTYEHAGDPVVRMQQNILEDMPIWPHLTQEMDRRNKGDQDD